MERETSKPNDVDKFKMIREHNKNKTEAKWKYKVGLLGLQCKETTVMNNSGSWCNTSVMISCNIDQC